jgi:hypothetical protein
MAAKTCIICGKSLPLDKQHFRHRIKNGKGYFSSECRDCRREEKRKYRKKRQAQARDKLEDIESAGVEMFLAAGRQGGSNIPHSAEVIERVFDYFGGVGGFSAVLVKQYWDSAPGSNARNRLIETMCRLVSKNVEQGGAKKPLTLWSEEELEKELEARFAQAFRVINGEVHDDGKQQPKRLTAQEAEKASDLESAVATFEADADRIREGVSERDTGRVTVKKSRGPSALPADGTASQDSRLQGE